MEVETDPAKPLTITLKRSSEKAGLENPEAKLQKSEAPETITDAKKKRTKQRKVIYSNPKPGEIIVKFVNVDRPIVDRLLEQMKGRKNAEGKDVSAVVLEQKQVRIGPSAAEIAGFRKDYLNEYRSRESTIERRKQKAMDPEEIRKKQEYAAREDVKERKRENAKKTRLLKKVIQSKYPDIYDKSLADVNEAYLRSIEKEVAKKEDENSETDTSSSSDSSDAE
jgi:hypothetical protein